MKSLRLFAVLAGVLALTTIACTKHEKSSPSSNKLSNPAELSGVFSAIDKTYDVNNTTLANMIEGISLDSNGKPARGIIDGQILFQGQTAAVHYYSDPFDTATLTKGSQIDITANLPADNDIGGPLTGTFECLNSDCSRAGVYFRCYVGAGFIFQQDKSGQYQLVNSVGSTVGLSEALASRGISPSL